MAQDDKVIPGGLYRQSKSAVTDEEFDFSGDVFDENEDSIDLSPRNQTFTRITRPYPKNGFV